MVGEFDACARHLLRFMVCRSVSPLMQSSIQPKFAYPETAFSRAGCGRSVIILSGQQRESHQSGGTNSWVGDILCSNLSFSRGYFAFLQKKNFEESDPARPGMYKEAAYHGLPAPPRAMSRLPI